MMDLTTNQNGYQQRSSPNPMAGSQSPVPQHGGMSPGGMSAGRGKESPTATRPNLRVVIPHTRQDPVSMNVDYYILLPNKN